MLSSNWLDLVQGPQQLWFHSQVIPRKQYFIASSRSSDSSGLCTNSSVIVPELTHLCLIYSWALTVTFSQYWEVMRISELTTIHCSEKFFWSRLKVVKSWFLRYVRHLTNMLNIFTCIYSYLIGLSKHFHSTISSTFTIFILQYLPFILFPSHILYFYKI